MPDLPISALPAATTPLGGTETVALVQGGVTKQTSVIDLSVGSVTLQTAFDNGQTIAMNAASVQGFSITFTEDGPVIPFKLEDENNSFPLLIESDTSGSKFLFVTQYDFLVKENPSAPSSNWGVNGASKLLKFGMEKTAFRVGQASLDEYDDANIGFNTYGLGNNIYCSGSNQFAAGKSINLHSSSVNAFSIGVVNNVFDASNVMVLGSLNTVTGQGDNINALGSNINIACNLSNNITAIGQNITLIETSHSNVIAMGANISRINERNSFIYNDGSTALSSSDVLGNNTFNVIASDRAYFRTQTLATTASEIFFDQEVNTLGTYTPRVTYKVACDNACSVGSPLTAEGTVVPFVLRSVLAVDPEDTAIVAIALEASPGGTFIKVCACLLTVLNKSATISITQGDLLEKDNAIDGAVRVGNKAGSFAVAAENAGLGTTQVNAWLLRSAL